MFKRAFGLMAGILAVVLALGFSVQWQGLQQLPSRFDTGMSLDKAFKQSPTPLLVEFYSDTCRTCQQVTPGIHQLVTEQFKGKLTMVMVDTNNPDNQMFAQLFGVSTLPAVYTFNPKKMKKHVVPLTLLNKPAELATFLNTILVQAG
jgi:thiol:disulfide interchange protein